MQATKLHGPLPHVAKLSLYCTPQGQLITPLGNMRISVTPEEARELLEEMLARATRFASQPDKVFNAESLISNGPVTTH